MAWGVVAEEPWGAAEGGLGGRVRAVVAGVRGEEGRGALGRAALHFLRDWSELRY